MRKPPLLPLSRRHFIESAGKSAIAISLAPILQACSDGSDNRQPLNGPSSYGPLAPVADGTTGLPLLRLPQGFSYTSFGFGGTNGTLVFGRSVD